MKFLAAGAIAVFSLAFLLESNQAGDKAKYSISEVMLEAHKGGLMKKVAGGKANDDERKQLVGYYKALSQNMPPKGGAESWKKLTGALVKASEAAATGDADAAKTLTKLANCAGCHKKHKE